MSTCKGRAASVWPCQGKPQPSVHSSVPLSRCHLRNRHTWQRQETCPNWQRSLVWRSTRCQAHDGQARQPSSRTTEETIGTLDSLLSGSESDDEQATNAAAASSSRAVPGRRGRLKEAAERRVRPVYVYVLYYCFIVVYLAAAWLEWTDGDLAASVLVDGLVNDHLAVAAGQVPRLATSGFVCGSPLELFMVLATLITVGAELEALLGHSLFWAVYWLAGLAGALADASLSELPITFGPANAAAGMVGALVAFYGRNLALDERIAAQRREARRQRRLALNAQGLAGAGLGAGAGVAGVGMGAAAGEQAKAAKSFGNKVQESALLASRDSLDEAEAEVEVLPFYTVKLSTRLTAQGRAALNVLVALVVAGQGLLELGDASRSASWIGLLAALWTGFVLSFGAGPHYEVRYKPPEERERERERQEQEQQQEGAPRWQRQKGVPEADADGIQVVNLRTGAQSTNLLVGYVLFLGGAIGGWLVWMGTDL